VRLQWAGSAAAANRLVPQGSYGQYRIALYRDFPLILSYTIGLSTAVYLGRRVPCTEKVRIAAPVGMLAAITAGLCNVAQDWILLDALTHKPMQGIWPFRAAAALSFVKFSALAVAAGLGLIALATTLGCFIRSYHAHDR